MSDLSATVSALTQSLTLLTTHLEGPTVSHGRIPTQPGPVPIEGDYSHGLSGADLSARLEQKNPNGVNGEWARKKNNPTDFHRWSRERDPEGIAWDRPDGKRYYPLSE